MHLWIMLNFVEASRLFIFAQGIIMKNSMSHNPGMGVNLVESQPKKTKKVGTLERTSYKFRLGHQIFQTQIYLYKTKLCERSDLAFYHPQLIFYGTWQ